MPLSPHDIPQSLWANDALQVPPALLALHLEDLSRENLLGAATTGPGAIGGATTAEFREHYATMFRNGVCRVSAVLLDPAGRFASIPADLQTTFAAGSVCLLDAPSGACTASLGVLATLLELRLGKKVPQLPQTVHVFAADISGDALVKGAALLASLEAPLAAVGITVHLRTRVWDATSPTETASLVQWVLEAPRTAEHVLICESFSGATSAEKAEEAATRFPNFSGSVAHLMSSFSPERATLLWIEPRTKGAKHLFVFLGDLLHSLLRKKQSDTYEHEYHWFDSLVGRAHRCNVKVLRYLRGG